MIGLESGIVKLSPYTDEWQRLFEEEKERLQSVIGQHVLDIQHVGSTSIPGLSAKPIIDIAIAVNKFEEATICIHPIERLGYVYLGEYGISRRHYFQKGEPQTHHIHMNEIDSLDWEDQILFRDYLIRHSEVAQEYASLKMTLAQKFQKDRDRYVQEKAPFIEQVLRVARLEKLDSAGTR